MQGISEGWNGIIFAIYENFPSADGSTTFYAFVLKVVQRMMGYLWNMLKCSNKLMWFIWQYHMNEIFCKFQSS